MCPRYAGGAFPGWMVVDAIADFCDNRCLRFLPTQLVNVIVNSYYDGIKLKGYGERELDLVCGLPSGWFRF